MRIRKLIVVFLLLGAVVGGMVSLVISSPVAQAQAIGPLPTVEVTPLPALEFSISIWDRLRLIARDAWEHAGAIAYRNAVRTFTQQIAYDLAVYVGSGGQGQQPLFVTQGWGAYLKDVGDSAVGDGLDRLARDNGYLELGLCTPTGPGSARAQLIIGLTAFDEIKPRKPRCKLSDISKNWEAALADPKQFLKNFNVAFDLRQNDLGVALKVRENIIKDQEAQKKIAELELEANRGLKNITTPVTGAIKTPAAFLETQFGIGLQSASNEPLQITGNAIADALGTFTNTLASRLAKRLFTGLVTNPGGTGPSSLFGFNTGGIEYAIQVNSTISTPQLVSTNVPIDIISELVSCPSDLRYSNVNNCTIDRKLEQGLRKADEGKALTVAEAIQQGFINGGWKFKTTRPTTVRVPDAWYLSDIKKLRKARVVSVGWELAAENFASSNATLQEVVNAFDNCTDNPDTAENEARFCHLIDPNWVLRAPPSQCRLLGPGQILDTQGGGRQDTCADVEQCVAEGPDGSCQAWGYCLAEKNIWQFSGDSCEFPAGSGYSPYATCQNFTSPSGQISLLTNSLANFDDGICSGAAGCKWYSTVLNNAAGASTDKFSADITDRIYLKNLNQYNCTQNEQGCTSFLRLQSIESAPLAGELGDNLAEQLVNKVVASPGDSYTNYASVSTAHLKEAPEYLGCYDTDALGIAITDNDSALCKNYLKLCSAAEVGCELYSSTDGNAPVPAIIQATDYCPQECVNFNKYYQSPSFFEPTTTITKDFIPSTARTCTAQAAGCEEFTNLDQSAQGEQREYYSKLRQCIAADDTRAATYFTWIGSDLTGFQLKDWRLQSEDASNPDRGPETVSPACDAEFGTTNPDCKQFYTLTGYVHYRLASEVITASTTCSRYRATNVTLTDCGLTNGDWDASLGACIYDAIPGEGQKCQAQYNGCREYKGPNANNVQLVFPVSTFGDQEQIGGLSIDATPTSGWSSGVISNESLVAFGHSFSSGPTTNIERLIPNGVKAGNRYLVSFWAKKFPTSAAAESSLSVPAGSYPWAVAIPALTDDWQLYKVETNIPAGADLSVGVHMQITGDNQFVIDNITVKNNFDNFYLIKDSWKTPAVCTASYLGCKAYTNRASRQVAATGFSQLCKAEAVGCEPLINTQNSDSPQQLEVDIGEGYKVVTPVDKVVYRVYDQTKACPAAAEACRLVGEPNLSTTGEVTSWGDKLVKLDPDKFDPTNPTSPLCSKIQDRCQEFTQSDGSRHYFKDPGNSLCEYKLVNPAVGYGWYKRGTNEVCNLLTNASFEVTLDQGNNLLVNGSFESATSPEAPALPAPTTWTQSAGNPWVSDNTRFNEGKLSTKVHTSGTPRLAQTFRVTVGQTYTARVQTLAPNASTRTLRIFGCGADMTDTTQVPGVWQKLQLTFKPTTTICTIELSSSTSGGGVAGDTYFDDASVVIEERFNNWRRNGATTPGTSALTNLTARQSVAGQYWGSQVVEIESIANQYSGIWSENIDLGTPLKVAQDFVVSAHVYVPDIPQNVGMLSWQLSQHAVPFFNADISDPCPPRVPGGPDTCHHYDYEPNADITVTSADKGRWVYKQAVIKADAGVQFLSVGFITNFGSGDDCTPARCRANQVVYIDQLSITPGVIQPAYTCPANQSTCTGFQDPILTKQTYYYLNNNKLDRSSCAGQVGEKDGCLLFSDLSNGNLNYNANATYVKSRGENNSMVVPSTAQITDTNSIFRVNRSRVCGEWLSCQSESLQYDQTGNSKSVCYALGRCDQFGSQGAAKCGNWKTVAEPKPLDIAQYQARGTSWSDQDLSGYSIPGIYPLDTLKQKRYSTNPAAPNIRLTYLDGEDLGWNGSRDADDACSILYAVSDSRVCLPYDYGLTGDGPGELSEEYPGTAGKLCRLYPEAQAPFPSSLATFKAGGPDVEDGGNIERKNSGYTDANICQPFDADGNPQSCECSYQRVGYEQGETRYYGLFNQPDLSILTDKENNVRSRIARQDYLLGLRGYCLEKDSSRAINGVQDNACLTWLPLDVVSGDISIYDYAPDAGFNNPSIAYFCSAQGAYHRGSDGYNWNLGNQACHALDNDDGTMLYGSIELDSTWPTLHRDQIGSIVAHLNTWDEEGCEKGNRSGGGVDLMAGANYCRGFVQGGAEADASACNQITSTYWSSGGVTSGDYASKLFDNGAAVPTLVEWTTPKVNIANESLPVCGSDKNGIAMRAVFDNNDALIGFNVYACTRGHNGGASIAEKYPSDGTRGLVIQLKADYCAELSQVASGIENKAWTNRLLNSSSGYIIDLGTGQYNISSDLRPFGAIAGSVNIKENNIPVYQYTSAVRAASPYSCLGSGSFDCGVLSSPNICVGGPRDRQPCSAPSDGDTTGCGEGGICMGTRFTVPKEAAFEGAKRVQNLFAKLFGIYQLSDTHKGYDEVTGVPISQDISGSALSSSGRCSLTGTTCGNDAECAANTCSADKCAVTGESVSCVGALICGGAGSGGAFCPGGVAFGSTCSDDGSKCYYCRPNTCEPNHPQIRKVNQINTDPKEGGNGFTIIANGQPYDAGIPSNKLLSPAEVTAAFYAYNANGEQMPLREVRVDWLGDPDNASGASGKYKNHKAVCKKSTQVGYNFGDSPQACVDDAGVGVGYFTFNRSLTCSPGGLGLKSCGDSSLLPYQACWDENGGGAGVGACVFKPRVYVRDNWDWCFGGASAAIATGRWGVGAVLGAACNLTDAGAWLPFPEFGGQVIVKP